MNTKSLSAILLASLYLTGCATTSPRLERDTFESCGDRKKSDLKYDPKTAFFTSDCKGYEANEVEEVLDELFKTEKPIILFVHGRGKEPKKSLKGGSIVTGLAVHKLESQYDAKVLMFSWDSERGGLGLVGITDRTRPLANIPEASEKLNELLIRIRQYRANKNTNKPLVLLAHSMGTIVLQNLVENEALKSWPSSDGPIFSNVVISSSDADNLGHEKWVQQIALTERTYVTFNNGDGTLKISTEARPEGAVALGLNPGPIFASNANYINLTGLGMSISSQDEEDNDHHEMFNKCSMFNQVNMCQFYDSALRGNEPSLDSNTAEKSERVYSLKSKIDKNSACFTNKCDFKKSQ